MLGFWTEKYFAFTVHLFTMHPGLKMGTSKSLPLSPYQGVIPSVDTYGHLTLQTLVGSEKSFYLELYVNNCMSVALARILNKSFINHITFVFNG